MDNYKGALVLVDATARNLLTLLNAANFTKCTHADEVTIVAGSAALTIGSSSAAATGGLPIAANATFVERTGMQPIDLATFWVKAGAGTTFFVSVRGI